MNKKEIATVIIIGVLVAVGAGVGGFFLTHSLGSDFSSNSSDDTSKTSDKTEEKTENKTATDTVKVGKFTLKTGKYATADRDSKGNRVVQTVVVLRKDSFVREGKTYKYTVNGDRIKLESGITYQATNNDTILLEAGAGVEFKYQGN